VPDEVRRFDDVATPATAYGGGEFDDDALSGCERVNPI